MPYLPQVVRNIKDFRFFFSKFKSIDFQLRDKQNIYRIIILESFHIVMIIIQWYFTMVFHNGISIMHDDSYIILFLLNEKQYMIPLFLISNNYQMSRFLEDCMYHCPSYHTEYIFIIYIWLRVEHQGI